MVLSSCPFTATSWSPGFTPPFAPGPLASTRSATSFPPCSTHQTPSSGTGNSLSFWKLNPANTTAATVSKKSKTATKRAWLSRFMGFGSGSGALGRCEGPNNSPSCTRSVSNFAAMSIPTSESLTSATQRNFRNYRWIFEHELRLFGCFCGIPYLLVVESLSLKSWRRAARRSAGIFGDSGQCFSDDRRHDGLLEASSSGNGSTYGLRFAVLAGLRQGFFFVPVER